MGGKGLEAQLGARVNLSHVLPVNVTVEPMDDDRSLLCFGDFIGIFLRSVVAVELTGLDLDTAWP